MKILQINTTSNSGSTGRIAEEIGQTILKNGEDSYIAYSRAGLPSSSIPVPIGNTRDVYVHVLQTRLFDTHGFGSKKATEVFLEEIEVIAPDVVHLHNIHGYYLHVGMLFQFLKEKNIPVIWTLHDCWSFTGHCTYFESVGCEKWKTQCYQCPKKAMYPQSWFLDNSKNNYKEKKKAFTGLRNVHIVTPSHWLKKLVAQSFLKDYSVTVIPNGIDLNQFKPNMEFNLQQKKLLENKRIVLGVASIWDARKGLQDFIKLADLLDANAYQIVLIGLSKKQIRQLPNSILGISRTESIQELASWYGAASVFVNPTYQDNFPTTNIEALACGTPVITYNTGGSPEAIDEKTGIVVDKGDVEGIKTAIEKMEKSADSFQKEQCRERAVLFFDKEKRFQDYFELYKELVHA